MPEIFRAVSLTKNSARADIHQTYCDHSFSWGALSLE
jgi:hypothetical protein